MKRLFLMLILVVGGATMPRVVNAAQRMYEKTPVNTIRLVTVPGSVVIRSTGVGDYFSSSNELFRTLLRYISSNDISMTAPVVAEIDPGVMQFYVGDKDVSRALTDTMNVVVERLPERLVAAIGFRGGYSRKNYESALEKLEEWLGERPELRIAGKPYAVYWDPPFVPSLVKRSEVHIPVKKAQE